MAEAKINCQFQCETRLDCLDEELIRELHAVGLRGMNVGIESPTDDVLAKNARKPIGKSHQEAMIRFAERLGVKVNCFYILGYPQDTEESIRRTIRYAQRVNSFNATFFVYTPLPGTDGYAALKDRVCCNWEELDGFSLAYKHDFLTRAQVARLIGDAYTGYYFRPAYLAKYLMEKARDILSDAG